MSLEYDADTQLCLRGSDRIEIRTVSDFLANQSRLSRAECIRLSRELGLSSLGRPRECVAPLVDDAGNAVRDRHGRVRTAPRRPSREDLGIAVDLETGKPMPQLSDEALHAIDLDCDPDLYGKSPDEIVAILEARERGEDIVAENEAFWSEMMAHPISGRSGGGDRGRKKEPPKAPSIIDRTAAYASERSLER